MQRLAAQGRTVLVSSHLLSEMALTASELVVIGRGRLIAQLRTTEFVDGPSGSSVLVRSPRSDGLAGALREQGHTVTDGAGEHTLLVTGTTTDQVGQLAAARGLVVLELALQRGSEEAFMQMTGQDAEFTARGNGAVLVMT